MVNHEQVRISATRTSMDLMGSQWDKETKNGNRGIYIDSPAICFIGKLQIYHFPFNQVSLIEVYANKW